MFPPSYTHFRCTTLPLNFTVVLTDIHSLQPTLTGFLSRLVGCIKFRRRSRERLFDYLAIGLLLCDLYHFSLRLRARLTK